MKAPMFKISALLLAAAVSIAAAPVNAYAAADFTSPANLTQEEYEAICEQHLSRETVTTQDGQFSYQVERDPHLCAVVREYHGTDGDVYVPDVLDRLRISYSYLDFAGREDIRSVTYGGTAIWLGIRGSYANCTNLESFTVNSGYSDALLESYFPDGKIPYENCGSVSIYSSFENCTNLKSVQLPNITMNNYNHIAEYVFKNCTALPEITLNGYWNVDEGAFLGCTALTKAVFNENIQSIGDYALGYVENEDGTFSRYDGLTIYGVSGTAAETYAAENDIPFVEIYLRGDANGDAVLDFADAVLLQNWLFGAADAELVNWKAADYNNDGVLNASDLTLLKRDIIKKLGAAKITYTDIIALAKKGDALTWSDFAPYQGEDIGKDSHIMKYEIANDDDAYILVSGADKEEKPDEILYVWIEYGWRDEPYMDFRSEEFLEYVEFAEAWGNIPEDDETNRTTAKLLGEYALAELQNGTYTTETKITSSNASELMHERFAEMYLNSAFYQIAFVDAHTVLLPMPKGFFDVHGYLVTDGIVSYGAGEDVSVPNQGFDGDMVWIKWAEGDLYYFYAGT